MQVALCERRGGDGGEGAREVRDGEGFLCDVESTVRGSSASGA